MNEAYCNVLLVVGVAMLAARATLRVNASSTPYSPRLSMLLQTTLLTSACARMQ